MISMPFDSSVPIGLEVLSRVDGVELGRRRQIAGRIAPPDHTRLLVTTEKAARLVR